jgi:hypothetical protein
MRYYVYILLDNTIKGEFHNTYCNVEFKPFYVGKGDRYSKNKNKRHLVHYNEVKNNKNVKNKHKYHVIKKLLQENHEPLFVIPFENDDEKLVLEIEKELIKFYGRKCDGGILTNISEGGVGGNLFDVVDGFKERLSKINSDRWSGSKNPNYNRKKEETYSYLYKKEHGKHWNLGKEMSEETKRKIIKTRLSKLPLVERLYPENYEVIETMTTKDFISTYNLHGSSFYRALNKGYKYLGCLWKYKDKDLVIPITKTEGYQTPKREKKPIKFYYKENINDVNEIEFNSYEEAVIVTGFCKGVIERKLRRNNSYDKIFRRENSKYTFNIKPLGKKVEGTNLITGEIIVFNTITDAAKHVNGSLSAIVQTCKGKRNKHKNYKFKYLK